MPTSEPSSIRARSGGARTFKPNHLGRAVNIYPLTENEMVSLATATTKQTEFGAAASFLFGGALSCFLSGVTVAGPWSAVQTAMFVMLPILAIAGGILCALAAWRESRERRSTLDRVMAQCEQGTIQST